ncbi:hypothetical protein N8G13_00595 [Mycoplasma zalophi]|uniref:hypothetical protein n=1 Tax=Mycoplasma zalophi TaxID=191287 RepID=UPI0021CA53AD|nr:hypothetical protein [Mycoplasma zalophi]MCU4116964.1 hypothetical protein [Mycoplasma zalophi]
MTFKTKEKIKKITKTIWSKKRLVFSFIVIVVGLAFVVLAFYGLLALPFKWN